MNIIYNVVAQIIELIAIFVMLAAMYYGYVVKSAIPKELTSLNLIVYALFFMVLRRVFRLLEFTDGAFEVMVSFLSLIIAALILMAFYRIYQGLKE